MARLDAGAAGGKNVLAFLDTLAFSELGGEILAHSDDGYNVLVGSKPDMIFTFSSYLRHPGALLDVDGKPGGLESSAAGRYQILARNWPNYKYQLGLTDFTPQSQDRIAIQLMTECQAVSMIKNGLFDQAVSACRSRWASLPGAGYGQHEQGLVDLRAAFRAAGGLIGEPA